MQVNDFREILNACKEYQKNAYFMQIKYRMQVGVLRAYVIQNTRLTF